ncbi:glycosyltransferase family 2 protein [Glaciibacter flavus]|uniref:Glycosyltransferase family 2 protein n=1 Tax=Orlajensenia flava TaxID=2565934 RepID=A0A4S4FG11_9MICO|nr:glycosyltransferase family 2 protein [Glaciibacter flavus]THG29113.1 glycosyltransferase family 2 protein [Glaciibacter flavus]
MRRGEDGSSRGTPTVTVVIPARNDAEHLRRCLRSLAAQTVPPDAVIVVDNGSTDDTGAVALRHGARVIVERETGIGAASAAGYHAATTDVIARLDADSTPAPDWVGTIVSAFARRGDVAAITGPAFFSDGPQRARTPLAALYLGSYFVLTGLALGHVPLFGSNMAFRRSAWLSVSAHVHTHDALAHDDLDLSYHLGVDQRIRFVPSLRSGISMRPLSDGKGRLRIRRGFHTIAVHWPHELPWLRVFRRMATTPPAGRARARPNRPAAAAPSALGGVVGQNLVDVDGPEQL